MRPSLCRLYDPERVEKLLQTLSPGATHARLEAHAAELAGLPSAAGDADRIQKVVNAAVRAVATEWLIEVRGCCCRVLASRLLTWLRIVDSICWGS